MIPRLFAVVIQTFLSYCSWILVLRTCSIEDLGLYSIFLSPSFLAPILDLGFSNQIYQLSLQQIVPKAREISFDFLTELLNVITRIILVFLVFAPLYIISSHYNSPGVKFELVVFIIILGFLNLSLSLAKQTMILYALGAGYTRFVSSVGVVSECIRIIILYILLKVFSENLYLAPVTASLIYLFFSVITFLILLPLPTWANTSTLSRTSSSLSFLKPPSQAFSALALLGFLNNQIERIIMPLLFPLTSIATIDNAQKVSLNLKSIIGQLAPTLTKFFLANDNNKNPYPALVIYGVCTILTIFSYHIADSVYKIFFINSFFSDRSTMKELTALSMVLLFSQISLLFSYRSLLYIQGSKKCFVRLEAGFVGVNLFFSTFIASLWGIQFVIVGSIISSVGMLVYTSGQFFRTHRAYSLITAALVCSLITTTTTLALLR